MQGRYENKNRENAVSEVIGAVMLIAVVVTAIAVIGVVLTSQSQPEKIPAIDAIISSNGKDTIRIFHNGGDSLTSQQIAILVDGVDRTSSFTIQGSSWTTWSPGQFLDYNFGSLPGKVQLIYKSPSTHTVLVSADFAGGMPTFVPTTATTPGPAATVSGISPPAGTTGTALSATISGSGFVNGATAKLTQGSASITATSVMVISQGQLTCTFSLNGAATGQWNVVVTNPSSPPATLPNGFTVITPGSAPTVTRISPNSAFSGTTTPIRNLTGTNFVLGTSPTVKLSRSGNADFFATSVQVLDTRNISCTLTIPAGTIAGAWDVMVINSDGQSGTLTQGFTVYNPGPVITGITPASGTVGTIVSITNLAGTGFTSGTTVMLNGTSFTDIPASNIIVINSRQITCSFDLSSASTGTRNVVVSNADGTNMLANGFVVGGVAPSVYSLTPNNGVQGTTLSNVLVGGTGFINGASVTLRKSGSPDINATTVSLGSATSLTSTFVIPPTATLGQYDVIVSNPDGKYGTLPASSGFTVNAPLPSPLISAITPSSGTIGSIVSITNLQGSNFQSGTRIFLNSTSGAANISVLGVTFVGSTQLTGVADLTGAPAGQRTVVVINPDGQSGTLPNGFTISATSPAPVTADFAGAPTTGIVPLTVQFADGSTGSPATYSWNFGDTGTSSLKSPSHIYSTAGTYTVVLIVGNGTSTNTKTRTGYITVSPIPPTVTSVSPITGNHGWAVTPFTVLGTGFKSDATVRVNNSGSTLTPTSCSLSVPSSVTCTLDLSSAVAGTYNVVVTNAADASSGMSVGAFTVNNPALSITALYPNTARRSTAFPLAIKGTGFQPGALVKVVFSRSGSTSVTATGLTVVDPTWITCSVPATMTTTATWTLTLTNGDGTTTTTSFIVS
jgi:flagellin-like protein